MRWIVAAAVVAILGAVAWLAVGRASVEATATVDPDVTIVCSGSTSVSMDGCLDWGDDILELGPPSTTFEMQDVARLEISRPLLGFGSPCEVAYFLQRYPDDATWESDIACR